MRPEYLEINPNGTVPAMVHNGVPIIESSVMNEYIDEVFDGPSLVPSDPVARARMRVWVKFEDDVLHPAIRPASYALMVRPVVRSMNQEQLEHMMANHPNPDRAENWRRTINAPVDEAAVEAARAKATAAITRMDQSLADGKPWLAGDTFSLADIACAPMIDRMEWLMMAGLWNDMPALKSWIDRVKARPAYAKAFPDTSHRLPGPANPAEGSLYPDAV
jgi:glutathione S-transferase